MPSNAYYTTALMEEFKSSSPDVRLEVDRLVGEVVVNILLQNNSRFRRLEKSSTLTFVAGDDAEKLPADFRSIKKPLFQTEADGTLLRKVEIVSDVEFADRKLNTDYRGTLYAMVETRQTPTPAEYLVLNADPTETMYFKFSYYRIPQKTDADIIEDESILKNGVRHQFGKLIGEEKARNALVFYENHKGDLIENPGQRATALAIKPDAKTQRHNRRMRNYGRGG